MNRQHRLPHPSAPHERKMSAVAALKSLHLCDGVYCKTLNICGIRFSRFTENDILAHFNFGIHDISWIQIVKKV